MKRSLLPASLIFGLLACQADAPKFAIKHAEQRGRLEKNGLRFVIMPDPSTQMVEVDVRYEVGSREDPPGKAGLAHFVEHLMFQQKPDGQGTKPLMHFINQLSTFFNAYTNWDTTHYMTSSRADMLDALLKVEAMRMYYGCQTISEEEFLREREVVRNENRQRGGGAEGQMMPLILKAAYPAGHPYEREIGGDDEQLTTITLADACKFMKDYYVPERATVIVAGGIDVDQTTAAVEKWFGNLEARTGAPRKTVSPVTAVKTRKASHDLDIERPVVAISWPLPPSNTPEGEAASFGVWSAFNRTRQKAAEYDFATQVSPAVLGGQEAPIFSIIMELKSMGNLDEAMEFAWKAAKRAHLGMDEGTWQEIEEFKNQSKASVIAGLEELSSRTNTMGDMVQFTKDLDFDSNELYLFHELDKIGKFDGAKVAAAVKKALDPDKASVVIFRANEKGIKGDKRSKFKFSTKTHDAKEVPEVDPREAKIPLKVSTSLKVLDGAQRFTLGNGMRVVLMPVDAMPLVSAGLVFDVGTAHAPNNPALPVVAADFLSPAISAEVLYRTGVGVGCSVGSDYTVCGSHAVNIYLDVVIKGLERLIKAGEYSQKGIERWQKRLRTSYDSKLAQQNLEYQRQLLTAVYGPDHPYTKGELITPAAAAKVGYDDVMSFKNKHYSAANATLIVAGSFDARRAESLIREAFGGWDRGHKDKAIDPTPYQRTGPQFIGVVGKELPQLDVSIAYPAPAGIDGQEAARRVLADMLNLRMGDIRFKLGSTYGTYAGRSPRLGPSAYMMGGGVDSARAGESLKAMRDSIDSLRRGENFDVDFVRARRGLIQQLLGESTVSDQMRARLGTIAQYGLKPDYYNTLLQQVAAVSPAQVKALLAKELDPAYEVVVTMADRATLTKAFAEAGITDVKIVEPEYK